MGVLGFSSGSSGCCPGDQGVQQVWNMPRLLLGVPRCPQGCPGVGTEVMVMCGTSGVKSLVQVSPKPSRAQGVLAENPDFEWNLLRKTLEGKHDFASGFLEENLGEKS